MLYVVHFQRRPTGAQVSVERLFDQVRRASPPDVEYRVHVSPHPSRGVNGRIRNLVAARRACGSINHILGDVHYLAAALPPRRTILTVLDCAPLNRLRGWKREVLRMLWYDWPVRRARVVTTISDATRQELLNWVPRRAASKIRVVHCCVDARFQARPKGFDPVCPVILQVGTGWNKNLERVAQALEGIPCRWEIIGPLRSEQEQTLRQHRLDYRSLGKVSDAELMQAYERCDLLVFASLYEGFGLPIIEAQAVGRPVITSQQSAMPEVGGEAALYVDPEHPESIRKAVRQLIGDAALRDRLIEAGFANVRRFQPAAIAAQYAAIYQEVGSANGDPGP